MSAGGEAYAEAPRLGIGRYQRGAAALLCSMDTALSTDDRRQAWECARDDAHLAFRLLGGQTPQHSFWLCAVL
jgi:hypothetical protein